MARVKTQTRPNPPPDYPLAPQNRSTNTTGSKRKPPTAVVKGSAQKSKVKISRPSFKWHVEEVTREVMAELQGGKVGEEGGGGGVVMMKWEEEALDLLRGVVEGILESGGGGGRGGGRV